MRRLLALFLLAFPMQGQQPVVVSPGGSDGSVTFASSLLTPRMSWSCCEGLGRVLLHKDAQGCGQRVRPPRAGSLRLRVRCRWPQRDRSLQPADEAESFEHPERRARARPARLPWEIGDAARGTLHRHFYKSGDRGRRPGFHATRRRIPRWFEVSRVPCSTSYMDSATTRVPGDRRARACDSGQSDRRRQERPMLVVMPLGSALPKSSSVPGLGTRPCRGHGIVPGHLAPGSYASGKTGIPCFQGPQGPRHRRPLDGRSGNRFLRANTLNHFAWIGAFSSRNIGDDLESPPSRRSMFTPTHN